MLAVAADTSWTFEPGAAALVVLLTAVYVVRWRRSREEGGPRAAPGWRLASYLTGIVLIVVALFSPVDALGEQLFAMHMVQHVILLDLAAIACIAGLTKHILRPVTRQVHGIEQTPIGHPVFAIVLYVGVMWGWHVPAMYDAALRHSGVHVLEHVSFGVAGALYWWHLLSPIRSRLRFGGLQPVVYMLATKLLVGLLGIVLTFAPDAIYDFYKHQPQVWGLDPGDDQMLAGAIMAIEQSVVMGIALAYLFVRALAESEREEELRERYEDEPAPA